MPNMDKVRRAIELRRRKKALKAEEKAINREIKQLDEQLLETAIDGEGFDNLSVDGVTLYPNRRVWAGLEGDRVAAVEAIYNSPEEFGLRATLTSNAQSISKAVRDRIEAAIEEDPNIANLDGPDLLLAVFPMNIARHLRTWTATTLNARGVKEGDDLLMPCATELCHRPHYAMGLCRRCYERQRRARSRAEKEAAAQD